VKLLRHAPFAFWLVCAAVSVSVVALASRSEPAATFASKPADTTLADVMAWRARAMELTLRVANENDTREWLDAWATTAGGEAADLAKRTADTTLADAWRRASAAATAVGDADDRDSLFDALAQVNGHADRLAALYSGIPAGVPVTDPSTDVPSTDVPSTDVPSTDSPSTDSPTATTDPKEPA
jgi:hypothetical protein